MAKAAVSAQSDTEKEIWLPVVGWEGLYEVSNLGRVRSLDRATRYRCFCGHGEIIRNKKGKVLRLVYNIGYPTVQLADGARRERWLVHRIVCLAFNGPPPPGKPYVAHNDGQPGNASAGNLRWATTRENMADKWRHGTMLTGDNCPWAKITDEQVQEMRRNPQITNAKWAEQLGASKNHVSKIMVGALRSVPSGEWTGPWLNRAQRVPYGGLTARDKAYIINHPELSTSVLAERFGVNPRRIITFRCDHKRRKTPTK